MLGPVLILAASAGGKSSLMRYLRRHSELNILESDEEVMKANNGLWPDDKLKNDILIPEVTERVINLPDAIFFASYIPEALIVKAKTNGFRVILLDVSLNVLRQRNSYRMKNEGYDDVSKWQQEQINNYQRFLEAGYIDDVINGNQATEVLAKAITDQLSG